MADTALQILADELSGDPEAIGYAGMTDQQAADALNVVDRQLAVAFLSGVQIGNQVDLDEYNLLTADQKTTLRLMWPLLNIPTESGFYRDFLLATFPGGSATRTALMSAFIRTVSRAQELAELYNFEFRTVYVHHVAAARALIGG